MADAEHTREFRIFFNRFFFSYFILIIICTEICGQNPVSGSDHVEFLVKLYLPLFIPSVARIACYSAQTLQSGNHCHSRRTIFCLVLFGFKIVKMANKKTRGPDKAKTNTDNIVVKKQEDAPDIVKQPPVFTDDSRYSIFSNNQNV